jgi:predicted ATPase
MLTQINIRNFKAIQSSGILKLNPLTVFIGYNGVGKSSILEAMETIKVMTLQGLDASMQLWRGFENICYKGKTTQKNIAIQGKIKKFTAVEFQLKGKVLGQKLNFESSVLETPERLLFHTEKLTWGTNKLIRTPLFDGDKTILQEHIELKRWAESWQFLSMNTFLMGNPTPRKRTGGAITLQKDGSNIAEYLLDIRDTDSEAFNGIIETLKYVLPYAGDIQPQITSELEKLVYLTLTEQNFKVPGWLLSTGTLKMLALLAVFRHPNPAPLILIEELENGLDPRSIQLIVGEIRNFIQSTDSQVIVTTHSPYLLDLLLLSHIVVVERKNNQLIFNRPDDDESLKTWAKTYTPGQLYTMNRLTKQEL